MIGTNAYCTLYMIQRTQVFAISLRDLQYQAAIKKDIKSILEVLYKQNITIFGIYFQKFTRSHSFFIKDMIIKSY